jgi:hypothetical protein
MIFFNNLRKSPTCLLFIVSEAIFYIQFYYCVYLFISFTVISVFLSLYKSNKAFSTTMQSSVVSLTSSQKELLAEADRFDSASERVSTIDAMREASQDNKVVLMENANKEALALEQQKTSLVQRLSEAAQENPSRSDDFEERIHIVRDAATTAVNTVKETADEAVNLIDSMASESANGALFLLMGEAIAVESLLGPIFILFSVVARLYSNPAFRAAFQFFCVNCVRKLGTIITK